MAVLVQPTEFLIAGRYRVDELIGAGGMGRVYRGVHTGIRRPVAIKILSPELGRKRDAAERFQREAFASGQLDHPNIVTVSDFGMIDDGSMYLAMEVLEGESLAQRLAREKYIDWPVAIEIMRGLLAGLQYAHDREIVHCDLKPDNLFLAHKHGSDVVKLLDFGIARLCATVEEEEAGMTIGTPAYLSPEQAVGGAITHASDIYSASVVLYEMLTGFPPFCDPSAADKLKAHVTREPPAFDPALGVPPALEALVRKGLAKAPSQRFESASDFQEQLDAVLVAEGLAPQPQVRTRLQTSGVAALPREIQDSTSSRVRLDTPMLTVMTARVRVRRWALTLGAALAIGGVAIAATARSSARATPTTTGAVAPAPLVQVIAPAAAEPTVVRADARVEAAMAAIAAGRISSPPGDNALELIGQLAQDRPDDPRIADLRGRAVSALRGGAQLLWAHDKKDSAAILYEELLRVVPDDTVARDRVAVVSAKTGQPHPAASGSAAGASGADLARVRWLVSQVDLAILERRMVAPAHHNALDYLLELRRLDPTNDAVGRLSGAVVAALSEQARTAKPDDAAVLLAAAKQAAAAGTSARTVDRPRDSGAAMKLVTDGNAALARGRYADAEIAFRRAIAADSASHAAVAGLAEVAYNRGDFAHAALQAKSAVQLAPRVVAYRMELAKAFYKLMRYDDAIAQWKYALQLDPRNETAKSHIALARRTAGR